MLFGRRRKWAQIRRKLVHHRPNILTKFTGIGFPGESLLVTPDPQTFLEGECVELGWGAGETTVGNMAGGVKETRDKISTKDATTLKSTACVIL